MTLRRAEAALLGFGALMAGSEVWSCAQQHEGRVNGGERPESTSTRTDSEVARTPTYLAGRTNE